MVTAFKQSVFLCAMKKSNKKRKGNSIIDERGGGWVKKLCVGQNKRCLPTHLVRRLPPASNTNGHGHCEDKNLNYYDDCDICKW